MLMRQVCVIEGSCMKNPEKELKKYEYYPKDPRKLSYREVIHKMRDFRFFYILTSPIWVFWVAMAASVIFGWATIDIASDGEKKGFIIYTIVTAVLFFVNIGIYKLVPYIVKHKETEHLMIDNTRAGLPEILETELIGELEKDFAKGFMFIKSHNIAISEGYVIGNVNLNTLSPVAVPKKEIRIVDYQIYQAPSTYIVHNGHIAAAKNIVQNFYFRLRNGNTITVQVNDKWKSGLALQALQKAGIATRDMGAPVREKKAKGK